MRSSSPSSLINGLIIATASLLVATPTLLAETFLVPKHSQLAYNTGLVREVLEGLEGKQVLLLGESTIRALHINSVLSKQDTFFGNLSLPGSVGSEMMETLRLALKEEGSAHTVIYTTFEPAALRSSASPNSYTPLLLSHEEIFRRMLNGQLSWSEALSYGLRRSLWLLNAKDEILASLLGNFSQDLWAAAQKPGGPGAAREGAGEKPDPFREIVELCRKSGLRFVVALTPFSSERRKRQDFQDTQKNFRALCEPSVECWDLSSEFPDSYFLGDGFHYSEEGREPYLRLLRRRLGTTKI